MISTISHARSYARELKRMLKPYGVKHLQAHDIAARTLGFRDWRTLSSAKAITTNRDKVAMRLGEELAKVGGADAADIIGRLLPPAEGESTEIVVYTPLDMHYSPIEFIGLSRPGHKSEAPRDQETLADGWEEMFDMYELNEPVSLPDMWHYFNEDIPLSECTSPLVDEYRDIFGSWPREATVYSILSHILTEEPLPPRLARNKAYRERCVAHREAIRSLIPKDHVSKPYGFLAIDILPMPQGTHDQRLLAWSWIAIDGVDGDLTGMPFVTTRTILTPTRVGESMADAMKGRPIAFAGVTGADMDVTDLHDPADLDNEPRYDDRTFRYWFEAKDGQMSDVQYALHQDFAPSQGFDTVEEWSSERRSRGDGSDVYVVEYLEASHQQLYAPALKAAVDAIRRNIKGILPLTRDLDGLIATITVGSDAILDEDGNPLALMTDEDAEKKSKYERYVRFNGIEEYEDRYPIMGEPGVVVCDIGISGGRLSAMLPGITVHEYHPGSLDRSHLPRPPRNRPNPITKEIDALDDEIEDMDEHFRFCQENMEPDELILQAHGYEAEKVTGDTLVEMAVQLGIAARGVLAPDDLLSRWDGDKGILHPRHLELSSVGRIMEKEEAGSQDCATISIARTCDNVILDRRGFRIRDRTAEVPGGRAADLATAILKRLAEIAPHVAENAAREMYAAAFPRDTAPGRNQAKAERENLIFEVRSGKRSAVPVTA